MNVDAIRQAFAETVELTDEDHLVLAAASRCDGGSTDWLRPDMVDDPFLAGYLRAIKAGGDDDEMARRYVAEVRAAVGDDAQVSDLTRIPRAVEDLLAGDRGALLEKASRLAGFSSGGVPAALLGRDGKSRVVSMAELMATDPADEPITVYRTGCDWFDDAMPEGGIVAGDKIILGAMPGGTKTTFGLAVALGAAIQSPDLRVTWLAGEMRPDALRMRMFIMASGLTKRVLRRPWDELSPEQQRLKAAARDELASLGDRLNIVKSPISPAAAEAMVDHYGSGLLVIDYVQLMRASERHGSRREEVEAVVHDMVHLADSHCVPVIMLSSAGKPPSGGDITTATAFKETGELLQQADMAFVGAKIPGTETRLKTHREPLESWGIRWRCEKQREGEPRDITVRFHTHTLRYTAEEFTDRDGDDGGES